MASSSRARAAVVATGILIATPAAAQSSDTPPPPPPAAQEKPATPPPPPARPMKMQPGANQATPPHRKGKRHAAPPHRKGKGHKGGPPARGTPIAGGANFYRLDDGSTRISVEVSEKVDVSEGRAQGRLIFRLKGVFIPERTNTLPLITGYFATPVDRAQLVQDGPDVELVIDLRDATTPTHRVVETPRGMVLQVDFPRVASAERAFEAPQDNVGRERAKRRTHTQSLGNDHNEGGPGEVH